MLINIPVSETDFYRISLSGEWRLVDDGGGWLWVNKSRRRNDGILFVKYQHMNRAGTTYGGFVDVDLIVGDRVVVQHQNVGSVLTITLTIENIS